MARVNHIINSFNGGELSEKMGDRGDQEKHAFGCRILENFVSLIYGGAERRPGLQYIAGQKSNSAKGRVVGFEHSVSDVYALLFENQIIRVFRDGAQVVDGVGTEDISGLDNIIAHWLLNETEGVTVVDDDGGTHNGTASVSCTTLTTTGIVNGCFDLDGQYTVEVSDSADFSFTDNSDDSAFSIVCWAYVTEQQSIQVLLSKWRNGLSTSEWRLSLTNERKLQLHLADSTLDLSSDRVAQWFLNDTDADQVVDDNVAAHVGALTPSNCDDVTATGKINECFDFAGSEAVEVADHANLSFGNGVADSAFSISAWIYVTDSGVTETIFAKYDYQTGSELREYYFRLFHGHHLYFVLHDDSVNRFASILQTGDLSVGWHHVVATYDGTGGALAASGMELYVDGSSVVHLHNFGNPNFADYVAMENTATKVTIGSRYVADGNLGDFYQDKIDNVILFDIELTPADVSFLWNSGNGIEDISGGGEVFAVSDDALTIGWHFLTCTCSTHADRTLAADDIILYVDGVAVDSTATNDANYTAMQNGAEEVRIGSQRNSGDSANENFWADKIDEVSIFGDVLTPTEVASLYSTTPFEIISPYLTADLPTLKFEHSADVKFITHPDYEPRRLSRTGHNIWALDAEDIQTGPFRGENTDLSKTITASATTGNITLTATGHTPFYTGTTAGHEPSGSADTSKSQTGALFKLVHGTGTPSIGESLNTTTVDAATTALAVPKGVTWDFTTNGTWGTGGPSTLVLERSYDAFTTKETVVTVTSLANKNITTSGTENFADATYRARVTNGDGTGTASIQISVRDTSHVGIVEITSVTSSTVALGTVLKTLGSTDLTHRWSEGSFSNKRGWPIDVTISAEERLTFTGNVTQPLTTWGSKVGDFTDYVGGTDDDDAITFTLVGTGQQNRIRWVIPKDALIIGTVGGAHLLGASKVDEALTPTNVRARLQTTKGSEDVAAIMINQAVLFAERGGRKIRELLFDFNSDSYKADDLTVFADHIMGTATTDGVVDMAYQRTPDPMLWCVRNDGQMAVMSYERDQKVFAWSRFVTVDGDDDSDFESVAVIYGGTRSEDEVWVTVRRTIGGSDVRYVERFKPRNWGSDDEDAFFVDSGLTYDSTATATVTAAHLKNETCSILGDGVVFDDAVANASTGVITLKKDGVAKTASVVQYGLGYTSTLKPMKLNIENQGRAVTYHINKGVLSLFKTMRGEWGQDTDNMNPIVYREAGQTSAEFPLTTDDVDMVFEGGHSRSGDIVIRQTDPVPMTLLALYLDVNVEDD